MKLKKEFNQSNGPMVIHQMISYLSFSLGFHTYYISKTISMMLLFAHFVGQHYRAVVKKSWLILVSLQLKVDYCRQSF